MGPLLYSLDIIIYIGIFGIISLSLNLEFGFAGLANFGKVAFFLVGAYTYALLSQLGLPFYLCLIAGIVISSLFGLGVCLPTLRLRMDYLAITVLAFGEILRLIVKSEEFAGGNWGIRVDPIFSWQGSALLFRLENAGLIFFCFLVCFILSQLLTNSPYGRILRAIREDEVAAAALGKNKSRYKAQVFMLGSGMAGLAGGLYVQYLYNVVPEMFMPMVTFTVWIMVLLGGPANNWGVLLGAGLVQIFDRGVKIIKDYIVLPIAPSDLQYILFGALIILMLFFRPQGLLKESQIETEALRLAKNAKKSITNKRS